jgi:hypothetical protein
MKTIALALCLMLPAAAFAQDPLPPSSDQPTAPALTPDPAAPQPAVENARWCGAHGGCGGRGKGKLLVLTGVVGTVVTAVAVGAAVHFATQNQQSVTR